MDVSIIIVNYNTKKLLCDCLDSIKKHVSNLIYEIIVVDNDSQDGSMIFLEKYYPWVKLINSGGNLGFGRANNLGIDIAQGKYVFFLNSDTILLNNAVKIFFDYYEDSTDKLGALGGVLHDENGNINNSFGEFLSIKSELRYKWRKIKERINGKSYFYNDYIGNVDFICGADLFVCKNVLDEVGVFDPDFFMYYEETELQMRMAKSGYIRSIINGTNIIHLDGGSFSGEYKFNYNRFIMSQRSRHLYINKTMNIFQYVMFRIYQTFNIPFLIFEKRFTWKERLSAMKFLFLFY